MMTDEIVQRAGSLLRSGALVVIPTETVYGLGANALDETAVEKIFQAKGRPSTDPLIVHISTRSQVDGLVRGISTQAEQLMEAFWPGPLTLIMKKSDQVPDNVTAGLDTVAVRVPNHDLARAIIDTAGVPIAAPSANKFGQVSPTTPAHVEAELSGTFDLLVDGGPCAHGVESTIVDTTSSPVRLLRPGSITMEQLQSVVGEVLQVTQTLHESTPAESPGQLIGHYSPHTRVVVVNKDPQGLSEMIDLHFSHIGGLVPLELPAKPTAAAQQLYAALREADEQHGELIVAPRFEDVGVGRALNDRLYRAAHGDFITSIDPIELTNAVLTRMS